LKEILIATKNKGKVKEFSDLFAEKGVRVSSLFDVPNVDDVEETGSTFVENAKIKAETISKLCNKIVVADDSGLSVDALDGRPGVFSARYAGEKKNDQLNLQKVLKEMEGVPFEKRTARFQCVLAVAIPNEETKIFEGTCDGYITDNPDGENGFGYDPIFYIVDKKQTMAQLSSDEKNRISHRANAMKKLSENWDTITLFS
jgi:XTP/dITP diphosphohydrolase